jgi:voltage-gated potassium channel
MRETDMRWLSECQKAMQWGNNLRVDLCQSKPLGYLALLVAMVTLVMGVMLYFIDPNIKSPFDGIWLAWVTLTHVGFGDVVPTSFTGRLLTAALILFGLLLFPLVTALISVTLIGKNFEAFGKDAHRFEQEANSIQSTEEKILRELVRLQKCVEDLEQKVSL